MKRNTYIYALLFLAIICGGIARADELKPIYRQPKDDFVANFNASGHQRIAQGLDVFAGKDPETGEVFSARALVMLAQKPETGEWSISALHNKIEGGVVLVGKNLIEPKSNAPRMLKTFDREVAEAVIPRMKGSAFDATFYPDEIKRLERDFNFKRAYSGDITRVTHPKFQDIQKEIGIVFVDILTGHTRGGFIVLMVDKYGISYKLFDGSHFSVGN